VAVSLDCFFSEPKQPGPIFPLPTGEPDAELIRQLATIEHAFGAIPDMWQLHETIERDDKGLWWKKAKCGLCNHPAWQFDSRGYRCFYHRGLRD
jgi:hypothetical protein